MKNWTIKNDGSEDFKNIVIPYLNHRFERKLAGDGNWYSVIGRELVVLGERPRFVTSLTLEDFIKKVMETREFKKGEKIMISGLNNEAEYIKSTPKHALFARFHKFKCDHGMFWAPEINVFQMPQEIKKPKKKKKFKNGEIVIIHEGEPNEARGLYIGKCPYGMKDYHAVDIDREIEPRYVFGKFITKRK